MMGTVWVLWLKGEITLHGTEAEALAHLRRVCADDPAVPKADSDLRSYLASRQGTLVEKYLPRSPFEPDQFVTILNSSKTYTVTQTSDDDLVRIVPNARDDHRPAFWIGVSILNPVTVTRPTLLDLLNTACNDVVKALTLPNRGVSDALALLVNVIGARFEDSGVTVEQVVEDSYPDDVGLTEIRGFVDD